MACRNCGYSGVQSQIEPTTTVATDTPTGRLVRLSVDDTLALLFNPPRSASGALVPRDNEPWDLCHWDWERALPWVSMAAILGGMLLLARKKAA